MRQLELSLRPCSTDFLVFWHDQSTRLSFHFIWFSLYGPLGKQSLQCGNFSYFILLIITSSDLRLGDLYLSQNLGEFHTFILQVGFWFVHVPSCNMVKFQFLYSSLWITFPTQSCLHLKYFDPSLLHSLIIWLMVSSLSPQNLHLQFCCVLLIFALK